VRADSVVPTSAEREQDWMRRILDLRIVRWQLKLLYVVGVIVIGWLIAALLRALGATALIVVIVTIPMDIAAFLLGARIFRGRGEPVQPTRAWWRMTARPTLSRRLGILFVVLFLVGVVGIIFTAIGVDGYRESAGGVDLTTSVFSALESALIAYLYLNSAARLKRLGVPPPEPKFRPVKYLKL
jgi:hypothetical protein